MQRALTCGCSILKPLLQRPDPSQPLPMQSSSISTPLKRGDYDYPAQQHLLSEKMPQNGQQQPALSEAATSCPPSPPAETNVVIQDRYVILPGGMYAKPQDVYVESLPAGKGRRSTGTLAMNLKELMARYDALEFHYPRLKEENLKLRQILFELYKKLPSVHPQNLGEAGGKLREAMGLPLIPSTAADAKHC